MRVSGGGGGRPRVCWPQKKTTKPLQPSHPPHSQRRPLPLPLRAAAVTAADVTVKHDDADAGRVDLTVTITPPAVEKAYKTALDRARKNTPVPGFRKGARVPDNLVIDALGGPAAARAAAAEVILTESLPISLGPYSSSAISGSERITDTIDALAAALAPGTPFSYHVTFETLPPLAWVGEVKGRDVVVPAAGDASTIAAAADAQLATVRKEKGKLQLVAAVRPDGLALVEGDVAVVDFDCLDSAGKPIPGAARSAVQLDTEDAEKLLGLPALIPGMVGMAVGEEKAIAMTLPDNWQPPTLAGATATAMVKVRELLTWNLPELTDEWAEAAYPGSGSVEGLRERLRAAVEAETVAATDARVQEALTSLLADAVSCPVPASVLREIGKAEYQAELLKLQASGRFLMDQIARLATPDLLQKFIDARKESLEGLHRAQRAMEALFEREGLKVDEAAAEAEFARAVDDFQKSGSEFDADRLKEQVAETMKGAAVIEWLKRLNTVTVGPVEAPKRSFGG